jgi:predicted amidohydrolase
LDVMEGLANAASDQAIDIVLGSMAVQADDRKWANRSMYFDHRGEGPVAPVTYDKIHMFDVDLASGESWRESNAYEPGKKVVAVEGTPVGRLGLTICYDLRFPALFEELGNRRCDAIAVPAAFTKPTGAAHWHVMLRARAIEASAFVIAAAQVGKHEDGRETYGHSLVVDPWGEVLLDMGGDRPGLGFCDIDLDRIAEVRRQVPSLANRREIPNS